MIKSIISYMNVSDRQVFIPALRCMGNIMTADDSRIVQMALDNGILQKLCMLLQNGPSGVLKEALWAVSNICAGPTDHIKIVINSPCFA